LVEKNATRGQKMKLVKGKGEKSERERGVGTGLDNATRKGRYALRAEFFNPHLSSD